MKLTTKLAVATVFVTLAACGGNRTANNTADMNAGTDLNASTTDMNATDMNAGGMNATGNADLNAGGAGTGATNTAGNASGATTNNGM